MALVHHFIISELSGVDEANYAVVGDDAIIANDRRGFDSYLNIMSRIDVKINLSKTIISEGEYPTLEFARNYIISGERI